MVEEIELMQKRGYLRDREQRLREIGDGRQEALSTEAANQIAHLKEALRELVSIVEIHSKQTGNSFAWAELDFAKSALNT